jgi:F-type H+-transporting ATPase subunit b
LRFFLPDFRFHKGLFRLAFLAALAAGMTAGTVCAVAQNAGTAPTSPAAPQPLVAHGPRTAAGAPKAGMPGEQSNPEEEQINSFLHAPAVKALAKFLHLSLGATDTIFLDLNYLIIFAAIGIPLVRFMPKVLRKRSQTLRHNLESARKLTEEATARLNAVEAQLAKLGEEIEKFRSDVEAEIKTGDQSGGGAGAARAAQICRRTGRGSCGKTDDTFAGDGSHAGGGVYRQPRKPERQRGRA